MERTHERNNVVYGATITPASNLFGSVFETRRQAINAAIRAGGIFDNVADFDAAIRDPNNQSQMFPAYDSGDHVHPNSAGYQILAKAASEPQTVKVGGWTETRPVSLGLLPSGPDPVGEWNVHRQPPARFLDQVRRFRNGRLASDPRS